MRLYDSYYNPKEHYEKQLDEIQNYILLNDKPEFEFEIVDANLEYGLHWLKNSSDKMKGEIIAGSFMCNYFNGSVEYNDIDIYFHSKEHAISWCKINDIILPISFVHSLCATVYKNFKKYNLIIGIPFENAQDLISKFDIRACAIAYDPLNCKIINVKGAVGDCINKRIVFQTQAKAITVKRLVKYIEKGFSIHPYQRVIFVELLKTKSNIDQELLGGY